MCIRDRKERGDMNQSEAALNQLISDNPKSPEIRDLYPYIISQSQLSKEDIPKRNNIGIIKTKDLNLIFCTLSN